MSMIKVKALSEAARSLTQAYAVGSPDRLSTGNPAMPTTFTGTYMASLSGDFLFEVGNGRVDARKHTQLMLQFAADTGVSFNEVFEEYRETIFALGTSKVTFLNVLSRIMGPTERPIDKKKLPKVTPSFVLDAISQYITSDYDIIRYMITDFVCQLLAELDWIMPDAPYVYRMRKPAAFPRFVDLIETVRAHEAVRTIQALTQADMSPIKKHIAASGAISPAIIAHRFTSAMTQAYEATRGAYDAESIVVSVLTVLGRVWSPTTPEELAPAERITRASGFNELRPNLALFLAYQDMIRSSSVQLTVSYSDEEMSSTIIPEFTRAMNEVSPYQWRALSDVTSFLGKKTSTDYDNQPGHVMVYENWDVTSEVTAFVDIKQTMEGEQRYLERHNTISSALESAMKPVHSSLNISRLVENRVDAFGLLPAGQRVPAGGAEIHLVFPSVVEREAALDLEAGSLERAILSGDAPDADMLDTNVFNHMVYDYRAMIMHSAIARAEDVKISTEESETLRAPVPYVIFRQRTGLVQPVGQSAIDSGFVDTAEPLEVITYQGDYEPLEALKANEIDLYEHRHAVHLWGWKQASHRLALDAPYPVSLRNKKYNVSVDEHEILGLGVRRRRVRFLRPTMATAIVRIWTQWIHDEHEFLTRAIESTKDETAREGYRGRRIQNGMHLARTLANIGVSGVGGNAVSMVRQRLVDQMYAENAIDDVSELSAGVQAHRLNIWSGLVVLQLLGLLSPAGVSGLMTYMSQNQSLTMLVAQLGNGRS